MPSKRELAALTSNLGGYWDSTNTTTGHTVETLTLAKAAPVAKEAVANGPILKTELGVFIDDYLDAILGEYIEEYDGVRFDSTPTEKDVIEAIQNAGADTVALFFRPLNYDFMSALKYFVGERSRWGGGTRKSRWVAEGGVNIEGVSAVDQMKEWADWFATLPMAQNTFSGAVRVERLDELIEELEAAK